VHGPESVVVTPFYAVVSIGAMRVSRPNGQTSRAGYDYFVASVPAMVLLDKGTAGNEHCQYCNYDCNYKRFHFSTPFVCFVGFEFPLVLFLFEKLTVLLPFFYCIMHISILTPLVAASL